MGQTRAAGNLVIFSLAALIAFTVLTPSPPAPAQFERKLDLLEQQGDIDAIFIGSSRTHFQFVPAAFDDEAAHLGLNVRSFNLGLAGAFGHEIDYLLDRHVLTTMRPRFVFIEFRGFEYQCPDQREKTFREIYWHDARRTLDSISTTMQSHLGPLRWAEAQDDLMHFGLRFTGRWPTHRGPVSPMDARGYTEWRLGAGQEPPQLVGEAHYDGNLVVNSASLVRQQRRLQSRGIEVFYVLPPGSPKFRELERLESSGAVHHVLRLNDPQRYPELFAPQNKGSLYLVREGAVEYSRRLARAFAQARSGKSSSG